MNVKYYDQSNDMIEIYNPSVQFEYFDKFKLTEQLSKNAWDTFVKDICDLKSNAEKIGIDEYYQETLEYSMFYEGSQRKIDTSSDLHVIKKDILKRTYYLKLPYLYRDFKKNKKYDFPIFMKSFLKKNSTSLCAELFSGHGRVLIISNYFPNDEINIFISKKTDYHLIKSTNINGLDEFFNNLVQISDKDYSQTTFEVLLMQYDESEYYVTGMEYYVNNIIDGFDKKNFWDNIMQSQKLWEYIYYTIINFELNSLNDYKSLLDTIVLGGQELISIRYFCK